MKDLDTVSLKKIDYFSLEDHYNLLKKEIIPKLVEVIDSKSFSGGDFVSDFEKSFSEYNHVKYVNAVNSGTSALHLALSALNIKEGDEVIVPTHTFIASAWPIAYLKATPVFVDCDPFTWNIDPIDVQRKITKKTKAIIGVHLYGEPFDVDNILNISNSEELSLIEDCAQAHGALYKGKKVGVFGDMGCFSFYPSKNLGAIGEAGAVITNYKQYYEKILKIRNHGSSSRYNHEEIGYNMRMDAIQGAVLELKLKYLDLWNSKRANISKMYREGIQNEQINFQSLNQHSKSANHLFVITSKRRNELIKYLRESNIECGIHYPIPCHLQKAFRYMGHREGDFPVAENLANSCVSLPMYPELGIDEIERIICIINEFN